MSKRLTLSVLSVLLASAACAWHDLGHMVVCKIAYGRLDKAVRAKVDRLVAVLGDAPGGGGKYDFMSASCWPDDIRRFDKNRKYDKWHYIDIAFSPDGTKLPQLDPVNAVWAIGECIKALKDSSLPDKDKAWRLAFLLHIIGDIHMPLHCIERHTKADPEGDRGGNDFKVQFQGRESNLHFFWDVGGGLLLPEIGRPQGKEDAKRIDDLAADCMRALPPSKANLSLDPMAWAREGNALARRFVYDTAEGGEPSAAYVDKTRSTTRRQLALAGYRMAAMLNSVFKDR
jgi:phage-related protein